MEAPDAAFHRRRDDLLYDSFAVFCLIAGFRAVIFFSSIPPSKENHGYCNA